MNHLYSNDDDRYSNKKNKFVNGKLTSEGCFMRHDRTRDEQLMTNTESARKNFNTHWNRTEMCEHQMMNCMHMLKNKGYTDLKADESVAEFVDRHREDLNGYV